MNTRLCGRRSPSRLFVPRQEPLDRAVLDARAAVYRKTQFSADPLSKRPRAEWILLPFKDEGVPATTLNLLDIVLGCHADNEERLQPEVFTTFVA